MVFITSLWLPIVLSAVIVFVASSIIHMVLPYHRSDYKKFPNEEKIREAIGKESLAPGLYHFPRAESMKEMSSPEMMEKYKQGPVGFVTIIPSGPPSMGKPLVLWFIFCLVVGFFVAYVTGRTLEPGAHYLAVFRVAGTVAFLSYSAAHAPNSIWMGAPWSSTLKHMFDGLVYGLLTAGTFGWLWPR